MPNETGGQAPPLSLSAEDASWRPGRLATWWSGLPAGPRGWLRRRINPDNQTRLHLARLIARRPGQVAVGAFTYGRPKVRFPESGAKLTIGRYGCGGISLAEARERLADARRAVGEGRSPAIEKQREKAAQWCVVPWTPDGDPRNSLGDWLTVAPDSSEIAMGIAVRDTDPTLEVIVVPIAPAGSAVRPPWLTENPNQVETLDTSTRPSDELAREVAGWAVRLPTAMTRWDLDDVVTALATARGRRRWRGWPWRGR